MGYLAVPVAEASACTLAGCLWCPSHGCSQGVHQAHSQALMGEDQLPSSLGCSSGCLVDFRSSLATGWRCYFHVMWPFQRVAHHRAAGFPQSEQNLKWHMILLLYSAHQKRISKSSSHSIVCSCMNTKKHGSWLGPSQRPSASDALYKMYNRVMNW